MKSLAPKYFEALPQLDSPAAYICVIRDIDRDRYRIEATRWPQALVNEVIAERERSFGIELVSVLKTDDLAASEAELYARHHARLSSEWLELDDLQLEELRRSMLRIDAHASHYLTRASLSHSDSAASGTLEAPASLSVFGAHSQPDVAKRRQWQRGLARSPIPDFQYGVGALRRNRQAAEARRAAEERQRLERLYRLSTEDRIKEYIGEFLIDHVVTITIIIIVLCILPLAHFVITNMR